MRLGRDTVRQMLRTTSLLLGLCLFSIACDSASTEKADGKAGAAKTAGKADPKAAKADAKAKADSKATDTKVDTKADAKAPDAKAPDAKAPDAKAPDAAATPTAAGFAAADLADLVAGKTIAHHVDSGRIAIFGQNVGTDEAFGASIYTLAKPTEAPKVVKAGEDKVDDTKLPTIATELAGFVAVACTPLVDGKVDLGADKVAFDAKKMTLTVTRDGKATSRKIENGGLTTVTAPCAAAIPSGPIVVRVHHNGDAIVEQVVEIF